ncbi:YdeI/OmpD-associated family protein [Flavobacteriaceae bacterium TP-CH-4]|uniref:YdeI/OmpD-associated family protein n=1 Tax=Pelagihabitans pacificus TaxID=2696054 RepID=A0A967AVK8_9FLAO|nr:YdeI/OmpD-associated family protein [Pelagihabitans pacificus]NHF60185.1 YdeI/OmpD-associated family protein [Pelagihabitans pacificus]
MKKFTGQQAIKQLEKRKGGYFYLKIDSKIINQFSRKRATRMICTIADKVSYRCGLNHLGDGNFYLIVAGKYLEELNKRLGEEVVYRIDEDPDQLGVEIPEVLSVLLEQDADSKEIFDKLTDGKKRSLIYSFIRTKDIDKQIKTIIDFLNKERLKMKK